MSKGIEDLGKGLGYIYVTDPTTLDILKVYENNANGVRQVKLDGVMAASVGGSRVATSIITIDAPTGNGSIASIHIGTAGTNAMDIAVPITYTGATTDEVLADAIVSAINGYTTGVVGEDFTAIRIVNEVYIFSDSASGTKYNGAAVILVNTGNFTYTATQNFTSGSSNAKNWDESIGYNFYLDADYGATQCSGGGVAVHTSISNAANITNYIVNIGLQGNLPKQRSTIINNAIVFDRIGVITRIALKGEGLADDDLVSIVVKEAADGDIVILTSATNTITVTNATGNLSLQTAMYNVITSDVMMLIYNGTDNTWYELNRSVQVIGSTANYRASGFGIFSKEGYATAAVGNGGTVTFVANTDTKYQKVTGTSVLAANQIYEADAAAEDGDEFFFEYDASVTVGAFALSIFGKSVSADQSLKGGLVFYTRHLDGSWYTNVYPNINVDNTYPFMVYSGLIESSAITVDKLETSLKTELLTVEVSFETGEVGDFKITIPFACTATEYYAYATKAIAATDNATITPKNNAGTTMTDGILTFTASDARDTAVTSTPSANNVFTAGQILTLTCAKATVGGKATVSVTLVRS